MSMPNEITMLDIINATTEGMDELDDWCESIYEETFQPYFDEVNDFYKKIEKSEWHPISDSDLEMILTTLPLKLFGVTESIHRLRTHHGIMKANAKRGMKSVENEADLKATKEAMMAVANAYENVIARAEREVMFCKELIMTAKKMWDARKRSESAMPIGEVVTPDNSDKLPGYVNNGGLNNGKL